MVKAKEAYCPRWPQGPGLDRSCTACAAGVGLVGIKSQEDHQMENCEDKKM